ncbi:MAG: DUF4367 domain-containing protein [Ruminiclostridium sp.]
MNSRESEPTLFDAVFAQAVIKNFEDELAEIPSRQELEKTYSFSAVHIAKMKKLFGQDKRKDILRRIGIWGRSTAAVIVIIMALFFGVMLSSPQVRAAVTDVIVQWYEKFTSFTSGTNEQTKVYNIEWWPAYLPDGFSEHEILQTGGINEICFYNTNGKDITLIYLTSTGSIAVNNEGVIYSTVTVNDIVYHLFESKEEGTRSSIVWDMNGYRFTILSEYPIKELQKMAVSVAAEK